MFATSRFEHAGGVVIPCGVDGLGQIDDDRPFAADEHVVLGQVAVDQSGAEHEDDLRDQRAVVFNAPVPRVSFTSLSRGALWPLSSTTSSINSTPRCS